MLENTESQEMYLTTIYALQKKNGMVRSVDVADERGYSKVSVHNAMKRLEEFGYVTFHQGKITLTKCGTVTIYFPSSTAKSSSPFSPGISTTPLPSSALVNSTFTNSVRLSPHSQT